MLRKIKKLLDIKYLYRRYNYWHTGLQFINAVLKTVGHSSLIEKDYNLLVSEVRNDKSLREYYERNLPFLRKTAPRKQLRNWDDLFNYGKGKIYAGVNIFYVLLRVLRPSFLIETGVASGSMSSFLLAALHRNNYGDLVSIDLSAQKGVRSMDWTLQDRTKIGFLIPDRYKDRWSLVLGDTTYELPKLLESRPAIDYFFHDSDHTFLHMTLEYIMAVKHMKPKGIIVSDDINNNDAFFYPF